MMLPKDLSGVAQLRPTSEQQSYHIMHIRDSSVTILMREERLLLKHIWKQRAWERKQQASSSIHSVMDKPRSPNLFDSPRIPHESSLGVQKENLPRERAGTIYSLTRLCVFA